MIATRGGPELLDRPKGSVVRHARGRRRVGQGGIVQLLFRCRLGVVPCQLTFVGVVEILDADFRKPSRPVPDPSPDGDVSVVFLANSSVEQFCSITVPVLRTGVPVSLRPFCGGWPPGG